MKVLNRDHNFLGINDSQFCSYEQSTCVIQQFPYEYTSSYHKGSAKGPESVMEASHFVEFYDPELMVETFRKCGIATLEPMEFGSLVDKQAMDLITQETGKHLENKKFVVSLGAEHTVSYGIFKAFHDLDPEIGILQLDAHSDLRQEYEDNKWSHASVMARIHELNPSIFQVGIRAQSIEEAELIRSDTRIHCWYAHAMQENDEWMNELVALLPQKLYITIDTDGFDPGICPGVGTAEPGGLRWYQTLKLLKKVFAKTEVLGFDIVELNPESPGDLTAYSMAQLCYKLIGYKYAL
jgi:agmatinase